MPDKSETSPLWFWNSNGLIDGEVPPGKPCPWIDECKAQGNRCPGHVSRRVVGGNRKGTIVEPTKPLLKDHPFSCALARLFSLMSEKDLTLRRSYES